MKPNKITTIVSPNILALRRKIQEVIEITNLIIDLLPEVEEVEEVVEVAKPKRKQVKK